MVFQKGKKPYIMTEKIRNKIRIALIGNKNNLGNKLSEETRKKIGQANAIALLGHKHPEKWKKQMSKRMKGNNYGFKKGQISWNYIDGRSKLLTPARYGDDWDKIRYLVYLRDRFTCQDCGIKGVRLDIHHKIPFLVSFDNSLNNLITLCGSCHRKEETRIMKEFKRQEVIILR
jgi:hypothetical protein